MADKQDVEEYIRRLKKYADVPELTREMALEMIEYITIDEYAADRPRDIHIYYKLLDKPLPNKLRLEIKKNENVCPFDTLTTLDIYSHIIKEADSESAEYIADIVLRRNKTS